MDYHRLFDKKITEICYELKLEILYEICQFHQRDESRTYYLENYFWDGEKEEYRNPNQIRYFLCRLVEEMRKEIGERKKKAEVARKTMNMARRELSSSDIMDNIYEYSKKWYHEKKYIRESVIEKYDIVLQKSGEVLAEELYILCVEDLIKYINIILDKYRDFFYEYQDIARDCKQVISDLLKELREPVKGVDRAVCASEECLNGMYEEMGKELEFYSTGSEISEWIYEYCCNKKDDRNLRKKFIQEKEIEAKWVRMFEKIYNKVFDINLFDAFEKEAEYTGSVLSGNQYILDALKRAETDFSAPLLTLCRKDDKAGTAYCIFSPKLKEGEKYAEVKKVFFENAKAISDDYEVDVDDKRLVFFQNQYGMEIFNVDFFAYYRGVKDSFAPGAGYESYMSVLERVTGKAKIANITPHIDKRWHRKDIMQDIDHKVEEEYFEWAAQAMLIDYLKEKIVYIEGNKEMQKEGTSSQVSISGMIDYYIMWIIESKRTVKETLEGVEKKNEHNDWKKDPDEETTLDNIFKNIIKIYYEELKDCKVAEEKVKGIIKAFAKFYDELGMKKGEDNIGTTFLERVLKNWREDMKNEVNAVSKNIEKYIEVLSKIERA